MNDKNIAVRKNILNLVKLWLPVVLWAAIIFIFSGLPTNPVSEIHWKDFVFKKTLHLIEYGLLTVLLYRALKSSFEDRKQALIVSFIISTFYGATDEFHQSFTPGRGPSVRDVAIDGIGSLFAVYFIYKILPISPGFVKDLAAKIDLV